MKLLALLVSVVIGITNFPQEKIAGQEFEILFNIVNAVPNSLYYGKALGGENFTKVDTGNSGDWYQQNTSWSSMPQFLSNSEGSISGVLRARFDTQISPGPQDLKIRFRKTDDDINYDSETVIIKISTPNPTVVPTNTPTLSPTQKPSSPVPIATSSPTPKSVVTMRPSPEPTLVIDETNKPEVLAVETNDTVLEKAKTSKPRNNLLILSIIIISLGIGLICVSGYLAYKIRYNSTRDQKN